MVLVLPVNTPWALLTAEWPQCANQQQRKTRCTAKICFITCFVDGRHDNRIKFNIIFEPYFLAALYSKEDECLIQLKDAKTD